MKRIVAIVMCGCALGVAGVAAAPVPTIPRLIEQLGSEQYSKREAATAALDALGASAIPALQTASRSENPEIRQRATSLLIKIRQSIESGTRLAAKRVKLDYRNLPIGTAVNDLRARTGLHLMLDPGRVADPLRKVTCTTSELPVWEAVEIFCQKAGLRELFVNELEVPKPKGPRRGYVPPPDPRADAVAIVLIDGKPDRLPGNRSSAVRVIALPSTFTGHKVTLGTGEYTFCLDVTPVPGLNWQEVTGVKVSRVIDSSGRLGAGGTDRSPVPAFDPTGMTIFARPGVAMRFDFQGNPMMPETIPNPRVVPITIKVATATSRSLKRLEGSIFGEINLVNQQLVAIADLKSNTGRAFEGPGELKVSLLEVKEAAPGAVGTIRVQLQYPSPWVVKSRRRGLNIGFNPGWPEPPQDPANGRTVHLLDAAGKPFPVQSSGYTDMNDDGMVTIQTLQYNFRKDAGLPAKLVVGGPMTVHIEVPFVMENVLLP